MIEFLHDYGLWILLGVIFIAMFLFGASYCGIGHRHASNAGKGEADSGKKT